ncbi:hypothetical protein E2C01_004004 [Portunus trituberculatus]|uniref:Uncharacterized protein n=1 Tax=Portunus trituberculatus TaxID=210409 RepID=A0A5B7CR97_PORTR|nr:hypothetical protein [Portunus trituberculatus]
MEAHRPDILPPYSSGHPGTHNVAINQTSSGLEGSGVSESQHVVAAARKASRHPWKSSAFLSVGSL